MKHIAFIFIVLFIGSCGNNKTDVTAKSEITPEMAYEGINNYCHSQYDWSSAEDNPSVMYVEMGEETESEYQVIFRSYTGAYVYFYVDKTTGATRMVEYVPALDVKNEAGSIDLFDLLEPDHPTAPQRTP